MFLDIRITLSHEGTDWALDVVVPDMPAHRLGILGGKGTEGALDSCSRFLGVPQLEVLVQAPSILEGEAAPPTLVHLLVLECNVLGQGLGVLGKLLAKVALLVLCPDVDAKIHGQPAPRTQGAPPEPLLVCLLHVVIESQNIFGGEVTAGTLDPQRGLHVSARVVLTQCRFVLQNELAVWALLVHSRDVGGHVWRGIPHEWAQ